MAVRLTGSRYKKMKVACLEVQTRVRGFLAKRHVSAMRKQFKNRPPRVWAKQLQRTYRSVRAWRSVWETCGRGRV